MKLDKVQLYQFRNISLASVEPSHRVTLLYGQNGSGKSSFIEALYYLGFGRSFRTNKHNSVVQHATEAFSVNARCKDDNGLSYSVGVQRGIDETFRCSIDGVHSNRLADLVSRVPVQLFTPQSTDLIIGSPSERRRFLDWGLFHVEQSFQFHAVGYRKLLRHRNAILKHSGTSPFQGQSYWDEQLIEYGQTIDSLRAKYVGDLEHVFSDIMKTFLPNFEITMSYYKGWEKELSLADALVKKREYDGKIGHTSVGPHKSDLRVKVNGRSAQEVLSRGQLRMAVAAMQLAQNSLFSRLTGRRCVFLLDDIGAELDEGKRELFVDQLLALDTQVFVTAIERKQLPFLRKYNDKKVFHVEHGSVKEE